MPRCDLDEGTELDRIQSGRKSKVSREYIAVIGERIVAQGEDPAQVWDKATTFAAEPLLSYVPKAEALIL